MAFAAAGRGAGGRLAAIARRPPSWLVVDFDGTCTERDTTALLPHLAEQHAPSAAGSPSKVAIFADFARQFAAGSEELCARHGLSTPSTELDLTGLEQYLRAEESFGVSVTHQVAVSGCLAGIRPEEVATTLSCWAADRTACPCVAAMPDLRHGCLETLAAAKGRGSKIGVLSINWCPAVIHAALGVERPFQLWSNTVDATGRIAVAVAGASSKRQKVSELKHQAAEAGEGPVVYVGDASTDVLALLEADIGFLLGSSSSVRRVLRCFGVGLRPLRDGEGTAVVEVANLEDIDGAIWEAQEWSDVCESLFGTGESGGRSRGDGAADH